MRVLLPFALVVSLLLTLLCAPTASSARLGPINRDTAIPDYTRGQSDPDKPWYVNRYGTMILNYWDTDSDKRSPVQIDTQSIPDRCPSHNYETTATQAVTVVDIVPDQVRLACVPSTVTPVEDPSGGTQPALQYGGDPKVCVQRRLSMIPRSGPMMRTISGLPSLVMKPCDLYHVQYNNKLNQPDLWGRVLNEPEIIHAHGQTPPYYLDGVPYLQINGSFGQLIQPGQSDTVTYKNPPYQQSGSYFVHSHFSFHHDDGVSMPLLLLGGPPEPHTLPGGSVVSYPAAEYNQLKAMEVEYQAQSPPYSDLKYEILMFFEDFCPISYTEGPPPASSTCAPAQNAYYALATQWRQADKVFSLTQCQAAGTAMDVSYTNHLCNNRSAEDAYAQEVTRGTTYHIRAINSAGMSNYLLNFDGLTFTVVAVDGNWIVPINTTSWWFTVAQRLDILVTIPTDAPANKIYRFMGWPEGAMFQAGILLYLDGNVPPRNYVSLGAHYDPQNNYVEKTGARWYQDDWLRPFDPRTPDPDRGYPWLDPAVFGGIQGDYGMYELTYTEINTTAWYGLRPRPVDRYYELDITGNNGFKSFNLNSFQLPPMVSEKSLVYADGKQINPNTGLQNPAKATRPLYVTYGDRVCIRVINHNTDAHAIHLHGHTFQVTEIDGWHLGDETTGYGGGRRDVVLTPRGQCRDVTFCFDAINEDLGVHPIHCHMSYHMHAGMLTTIEYVDSSKIAALTTTYKNTLAADTTNYLKKSSASAMASLSVMSVAAVLLSVVLMVAL